MNTELTVATSKPSADIVEQVVMAGDLSKLTPSQRVAYYQATCKSLGLNPLTKPFDYINLSGRLTLYAKRDATDQLRRINGVSITRLERERVEDIYTVTAYASDGEGRTDSSIGAVSIAGLKSDALANALMKAETKAKRRVTLSIVGLGWLDETEIETIPDAHPVAAEVVEAEPIPDNGHDADAEFDELEPAMPDPSKLKSMDELMNWAMRTGAFESRQHGLNAWDALKREQKPQTFPQMRGLWIADVLHRAGEKCQQPKFVDTELAEPA